MPVKKEYGNIVKNAVITAAGVGIPGSFIPALDITGIGATWTTMIYAMVKKEGHEIDKNDIAKVVAGIVTGVFYYAAGSKAINVFAKLFIVTLPGLVINIMLGGVNSALNATLTYRLGVFMSDQLSKPDFDLSILGKEITPYLKRLPHFRELEELRQLLFIEEYR